MNVRILFEGIGFSVLGIVLYQFQTTILIFVIPLVVLFKRQPYRVGLLGILGTFLGILLVKLFRGGGIEGTLRENLLILDLTYPITFLLGVALTEGSYFPRLPPYGRIALITVVSGILGIPLIRYVMTDPVFEAYLKAQIEAMLRALVESNTAVDLGTMGTLRTSEILRLSKMIFANTYTLGYFLTFLFNWVVGSRIGLRSRGIYPVGSVVGTVQLPEKLIWGFLLGWFGVLLSLIRPLGWVSILFWNVALLSTVLYGMQGVEILRYFLRKLQRLRAVILFMIVLFLFIPGLNVLIMFGIPLLGVSELWIQYRRTVEERSEE
ncbi:MAG: YybS family protein [Spirochaetes bacterium]|nr:YybS family protein [Spirochaetota bacterium]